MAIEAEVMGIPFLHAKKQNRALLGVGGGIVITLVLLPSWLNYWIEVNKERKLSFAAGNHQQETNYAKILYEKRMEYRRILEEDRKAQELKQQEVSK